jgi:hypothetical protein
MIREQDRKMLTWKGSNCALMKIVSWPIVIWKNHRNLKSGVWLMPEPGYEPSNPLKEV